MIAAQISAGIGNQLFQYATARAVSLRSGQPLRLDLAYYQVSPNRAYRLGAFGLPAAPASEEDLAYFLTPFHQMRFVRGAAFAFNGVLPFELRRIVVEHSPRFDSRIISLRRPVYLTGFWQSERYFLDYADVIRSELSLRTPVPVCYQPVINEIRLSESVGLVVRRGDYLSIPNTQGICTLAYYRAAVDTVTARVPNRRIFVFSDDMAWCRQNLGLDSRTVFVPNETPEKPEEHLRVLSYCRHFILANSSFAWWGAWLRESPGSVIIAPRRWMNPGDEFSDVVPNNWIRI